MPRTEYQYNVYGAVITAEGLPSSFGECVIAVPSGHRLLD